MEITINQEVSTRYPDYKMGIVEAIVNSYDVNLLQQQLTSGNPDAVQKSAEVEAKWMQVFNEMKASSKRLPSVVSLWNLHE